MSAHMLTAAIAVDAARTEPIDFAAGRTALEDIDDISLFGFVEPEWELADLLPDLEEESLSNGSPSLEAAQRAACHGFAQVIIDQLEEVLDSQETDTLLVGGYRLYLSAGLSHGDTPTEAAQTIWNASILPQKVLTAMGFIPDYSRSADAEVVDAIALGLGTKDEWSGADELEWIAETLARVREHPGNLEPPQYLERFTKAHHADPLEDAFLIGYINEAVDAEYEGLD